MNAFKGTPGPWRVDGALVIGSDIVHTHGRTRNSLGISSASYSERVCVVEGYCGVQDDGNDLPTAPRLNAALIAQAPAMLEALELCVAALKSGEPMQNRDDVTHYLISGAAIHGPLEKARAILAALREAGAI